MFTFMIRFILFGFCLTGLSYGQDSPAAAKSKIACEEPVFHFGKRSNSEKVQHDFVIRNDGEGPLILKSVKTSCGCTAARLKDTILPPGRSTTVSVTVNLKGRRGKQTKTATVNSNDPVKPRYKLTMKGTAIPMVDVKPSIINFGRVIQGNSSEASVEIIFAETPNSITAVKALADFYTTRIETLTEGRSYRLYAKLNDDLPPGKISSAIRLSTSLGASRFTTVQMTGTVIGDISVLPDKITLVSRGNKPETRYLVLQSGRVKEFKVLGVELPDERMTAKVLTLGAGKGYRIRLDNIVANEKLDKKKIVIKTDIETTPVIEVPFRLYKR